MEIKCDSFCATYMIYRVSKTLALSTSVLFGLHCDVAIAECDVQKTPLTNGGCCTEYMRIDKELNEHYKKLIRDIDPKKGRRLRDVQRAWIQWRDDKCDDVQESSGCNGNGSCNGVAHDYCIIDLTEQRVNELRRLILHIHSIREEDLLFSKEYQ